MGKRRRGSDSDGVGMDAPTPEYNTVFVNTSLDTHLIMLVSKSDTASEFKKKILLEHMGCFPNFGEIKIHSLKVSRRGNFYNVPDGVPVWSAFHTVKRRWYLSVDASCNSMSENPSELGTSNGVRMNSRNVDDILRCLSSDVNQIQTLLLSLPDDNTERNVVPEMVLAFKDEKYLENTVNVQINNHLEENDRGTDPRAKKKRKLRHTEESNSLLHASGKDASVPEIVGTVNKGSEGTILDEQQGKTISMEVFEVSKMSNDPSVIGERVAIEGTSAPATEEKNNLGMDSDRRKEDTVLESMAPENLISNKMESELGQDVASENSRGVSVKIPNLSAKLTDTSGAMIEPSSDGNKRKKKKSQKTDAKSHKPEEKEEDIGLSENHDRVVIKPSNAKASDHADLESAEKEASNLPQILDANAVTETVISTVSGAMIDANFDGNKRKKREGQKTARKIRDTTERDRSRKGESVKPYIESHKSEEKGAIGFSENHDREVTKPSNSKASDHADPESSQKETSNLLHLLDANAVTEHEISTVSKEKKKKKKEKREKKSVDPNLEKSGIEQSHNAVSHTSGLLCPPTNHISEETDKEQSTNIEKQVQVKLLDNSTVQASEEMHSTNGNEADCFISIQTEQTLEDVDTGKKKLEKVTQTSADNNYADFLSAENVKQITELNKIEKDGDNTENKVKKSTKKKKKRIPTTSDIQENMPVKDQNFGIEVLTTEANSTSFENHEQEGRNIPTSQVISRENEENLGKVHATAVNADVPSAENEKQITELNKVKKDGKNTENKDKKAKTKKKKRNPTGSDIQENMPVKDQNVGIEELTTEANSTSILNPEQEGVNISTSQVMARKNEEKFHKVHENADDPAKPSENEGKGIDFKEYFLPDQNQEKVESSEKVKTATKSNKEKKTREKVKENGLPSVSISTELQNSVRSLNKETEKKSRAMKDVRKKQGESAQNSDWDEITPGALKKSSRNGVKDASPNDMLERTIQKTNESFPGKRGNKRSDSGLNSTNVMAMKTPQKKSLLSKSGALFPDSSGESSGDENGTVYSGTVKHTPSDSSSLSEYSDGESDLSQDSTRNGLSDAEGRSTGGKSMSKLDLSASKDMTMDMILRSSKRFKKAKLQASQNEVELNDTEFVPESQPPI